MIHNLTINYNIENTNVSLSTETTDENLPYNLADIFIRVLKDSDANTDIVIESMIDEFGYKEAERVEPIQAQ